MFTPGTPEETKTAAKERLASRFKWIDEQLAGKNYLMGEQFTVADGYLFTVTNWTVPMKIDLAPYPNLVALRQRVAARPAVQKVMKDEGLV